MRTHLVVPLAVTVLSLIPRSVYSRSVAVAPPPEESLRAVGLATDPQSLIQYLENGIPLDYVPPPSEDTQRQPFLFRRFDLYDAMVSVLSKNNNPAAVPLLRKLQTGEFSPVMEADLAVYVAAQQRAGRDNTWDDWDQAVRYRRDWFRMSCAIGIERLTGNSPVPLLEELLRTWTPPVLENCTQVVDDHHLSRFYIAICRALTVHGSKVGIDALISILGDPRGERFPAASLLKQWTKQNYGPDYDDSVQTKAAEIEKWVAWWAANRETFIADVANINRLTPYPAPTTLRDRVWHVYEGRMDHDSLYSSEAAAAWLETNGARESRALRKIVEDENERMSVRAEALKWYLKFDRNPSYKMLLDYAKQPSNPYYNALASQARDSIKERFPERYIELNKMLLEMYPADASGSVHALVETAEGRAFLVDRFSSLREDPQFQVIQFFARQPNPPMSVLEEALLGDYLEAAAFAAVGVETSASEPRLSAPARSALNEWRKNPEFLTYRINFGGEHSATIQDFENVFNAIDAYNPHTAEIFARTRQTLYGFAPYNPNLQADPAGVARLEAEALRGFLQCVEAYRASRGQSTLPAYAF